MSTENQNSSNNGNVSAKDDTPFYFNAPKTTIDLATVLGLSFTFGFIVVAIALGQSNASFFNIPALLIVLFGSLTATATSYTISELVNAGDVVSKTMFRIVHIPSKMAKSLLDASVYAKKRGVLALSTHEKQLEKDPFLARSMQMVVDGYDANEIERLLKNEIDVMNEHHRRSAGITRRASEIAPAMGLIGTLVGLVQMLADLENPETIGPAMAVALLTTFYGAILGTIIMAPLAVKLEKYASEQTLIMTMIAKTAGSIARQDNPRRLEMMLNTELPPSERIRYFD